MIKERLLAASAAFLLLAVAITPAAAQDSAGGRLARFAAWEPREGQAEKFEAGYRLHLHWHQANADRWSWYGWVVASGPRRGLFVDATFGHAAADLDHPVDPAADAADNALHTVSFATLRQNFTVALLPAASSAVPTLARPFGAGPYVRAYHLLPTRIAGLRPLLSQLKARLVRKFPAQALYCYEWQDGGSLPQVLLLLPFASYAEGENISQMLDELLALDNARQPALREVQAETWRYRADLSYFPEGQ